MTTSGWDTIYIEKESFVQHRVVFKRNPDDVELVTIQLLKPENISIRMLPENILAHDLLEPHSEIPVIGSAHTDPW